MSRFRVAVRLPLENTLKTAENRDAGRKSVRIAAELAGALQDSALEASSLLELLQGLGVTTDTTSTLISQTNWSSEAAAASVIKYGTPRKLGYGYG